MSDAIFVYDDDCGFCTWWAEFMAAKADVQIVGFSELDPALEDRLPEEYETCSHLVTDGSVYSCGASVEETLLRTDLGPVARPVVRRLRRFGSYRDVREWGYRHGAHNRALWGKLLSKTPAERTADNSRTEDG
jgi:predicted DCC family thiol-disulfide oxidoreductase YuxK